MDVWCNSFIGLTHLPVDLSHQLRGAATLHVGASSALTVLVLFTLTVTHAVISHHTSHWCEPVLLEKQGQSKEYIIHHLLISFYSFFCILSTDHLNKIINIHMMHKMMVMTTTRFIIAITIIITIMLVGDD